MFTMTPLAAFSGAATEASKGSGTRQPGPKRLSPNEAQGRPIATKN